MSYKVFRGLVATMAALIAVTSFGASATAAPNAAAPKPSYVALGDSYASGNGARSYLRDGTSCYRSLKGYPGLVATAGNLALDLQACSGATTADVLNLQLNTLNASTAYVTITVGGNDIGFAPVLSTCLGTNTNACLNAVNQAVTTTTSTLPGRLSTLYAAVKAKAPNATITATGYPRLFNGRDCSLLTSFTASEMAALNAGADTLTGVVRDAAMAAGIGFTDVRGPFVGHAVCDRSAWIRNAQLFSSYESFHPNASGYQSGYTPSVKQSLGIGTATGTGMLTVTTGGSTSTNTNRGHVKVG